MKYVKLFLEGLKEGKEEALKEGPKTFITEEKLWFVAYILSMILILQLLS